MKIFIVIFIIITSSYSSNQQTFLLGKYDKEVELEAKIVSNIASSSLREKIRLFIPNVTKLEKKVYSKYFLLSENCEEANFIFMNKTIDEEQLCNVENKLFLTNNYQKLLADETFYGAFFWSKSRPNIVFIKDRLDNKKIVLPKSYDQYIEDF